MIKHLKQENGQMVLIAVIALMSIIFTVTGVIYVIGTNEYSTSQSDVNHTQAKAIADSGVDNALEQLVANQSYAGGTFTTPIGTATVTVTGPDGSNNYTIKSETTYNKITVEEQAIFNFTPRPAIENYAVFSQAELYATFANITGDVETNNNVYLDFETNIYGNVIAVGHGQGEKDTLNGAQILVNPSTGNGGNLTGLGSPVYVQSVYGWNGTTYGTFPGTVQNTATFQTSLHVDSNSSVGSSNKCPACASTILNNPTFNYSYWKTQAKANGTYYSSPNSFTNAILNNSSYSQITGNWWSGYVNTVTVPPGVYYIDDSRNNGILLPDTDNWGDVYDFDFSGSTIITPTFITVQGGLIMNSTYQNLPALVATELVNMGSQDLPPLSPTIVINGLIYSDQSVVIYGDEPYDPPPFNMFDDPETSADDYDITGAIWSGNTMDLENHTELTYDASVLNNMNPNAFNIPAQTTNIVSWQEITPQ